MTTFHRFFAASLLLAYAFTGTSMFPMAVWALAVVDGSHSVQVCETAQGTRIQLHHTESDFTPKVSDHRSPIGRLVVRFCGVSDHGDHTFSSAHLNASRVAEEEKSDKDDGQASESIAVSQQPFHRAWMMFTNHPTSSLWGMEDQVTIHALRTLPTVRMLI